MRGDSGGTEGMGGDDTLFINFHHLLSRSSR